VGKRERANKLRCGEEGKKGSNNEFKSVFEMHKIYPSV